MTDFVDFQTLRRRPSPNNYLLAPDGACEAAKPDGPAPVFDIPPQALAGAVRGVISRGRNWTRVREAEDGLRFSFVAVSPLMRFRDDVSVEVAPVAGDSERSTLMVYSASRVGYSDLGANAKRVRELIAALEAAQSPQ